MAPISIRPIVVFALISFALPVGAQKADDKQMAREAMAPFTGVGCELLIKLLLGVDTNHGSVVPNDNRPGERSFDR